MFKLVLSISTFAISAVLGNWADAVDSKGLIRIPLQNPEGHSWFLDMRVGDPKQTELTCVVDNNHALTMLFAKDCQTCPNKGRGYDYMDSETYMHRPQNISTTMDDGFVVRG